MMAVTVNQLCPSPSQEQFNSKGLKLAKIVVAIEPRDIVIYNEGGYEI